MSDLGANGAAHSSVECTSEVVPKKRPIAHRGGVFATRREASGFEQYSPQQSVPADRMAQHLGGEWKKFVHGIAFAESH